ncbi:sporulation initiation phosphotransferase B [Bacillus sp. Marseille-P3661]|uniref:sporulation initiation phosphotransferase B n=1 Tax=Bacillus sp. Marseille-P3661 TaxID=1936234 RepID=UPI000C85E47C|nr:sporulation initiation phosphotransferase B [Bacillus sp. Marseille-P3661]
MDKEWNAVEILRHSRHDWLNKIQLIKGNIALNRLDRVNGIIEEIIIDTQNETKLTNLKADRFASYLLTFNWNAHHFLLAFEIVGDGQDLSIIDTDLFLWCSEFFNILNESVQQYGDNQMNLSIQFSNKDVRFFFDFSGIIEGDSKILNFLENQNAHPSVNVIEHQVHNDEMLVMLKINI